ncbi:hypothetical protein UFOVP67_35 [uncultured Caudovirales phage]|uniref:Uncharacterized protein n=1 Tax=uncultured Caudovirales phage TaxID=2100421 RepID=A0A6J5TAQ2_9CAUD|nr:hypothetical protein UFOVP67_35 [uncultured Caudovirales phage]
MMDYYIRQYSKDTNILIKGYKMTVTKLFPSGAYEITDIINNRYCRKVYYYYTKREAIANFKSEFLGV